MKAQFERVSVVGLGYIGLPVAALLASRGVEVVGVDVNPVAVRAINEGRAHFSEPDLDALVQQAVATGRLRAVTQPEPAEAFVIAVPTPVAGDHAPDLSYVEAAAASLAPVLQKGNLIILESTSPVGTTEMISQNLAMLRPDLSFPNGHGESADILIAYCPERIIPGNMVAELVENDRIVGGLCPAASEAAAALYSTFVRGHLVPTSARAAEMVKLTENAFRDVNIAFANELSKVCDHFGVDVWEVIQLANHHPRVNILKPGPGVGGHCIAVDPWFIIHGAAGLASLMEAARRVNDGKPRYVAEKVLGMARPGDTITCLGLTYKPDTDDLRESPAVEVISQIAQRHQGTVLAVDPNVQAFPSKLLEAGVRQIDLAAGLSQSQMVVLLVDHRAFREIDPLMLGGKRLYDSCGLWCDPPDAMGNRLASSLRAAS